MRERHLAGRDFLPLEVAHQDLERGVPRLYPGQLAGHQQPAARSVVRIRGQITRDPNADLGGGHRPVHRGGQARRPVAILVGPHVEDLAGPDGHARAQDLHLHPPALAVIVGTVLLDADAVIAFQLAANPLEHAFGAGLGAVQSPTRHGRQVLERPRGQ